MQMTVEDQVHSNKQLQQSMGSYLKDKKVRHVVKADKRRLVEVPYSATLAHTMNALVANRVVAVPVAAPPGHWIGAGGSMILESDKHTGAVRKHYIGMVTMLDVLAHIAGDEVDGTGGDLDQKMSVPVSTVIGHCLESLSLWTLNPNTSIMDCMEVFSKGIHRALVPIDSNMENVGGVELVESASCYKMITQMDLLKFLRQSSSADHELQDILSQSVGELGAVSDHVFGVTDRTKVINAIKSMRAASLNAVPIVQAFSTAEEDNMLLIDGKGRRLVGTFSATDLRGCPISQLRSWLPVNVMEFTEKLSLNPPHVAAAPSDLATAPRQLVTCYTESLLSEVVDKAVTHHVHRIWVVDRMGLLLGLISITDIIRVIRASLLQQLC